MQAWQRSEGIGEKEGKGGIKEIARRRGNGSGEGTGMGEKL
jgi:hypothetical protein